MVSSARETTVILRAGDRSSIVTTFIEHDEENEIVHHRSGGPTNCDWFTPMKNAEID